MTDAELVKSKIDIVSFISDYTKLKKTGRNFKALCPFHSEKTPSFIVSPERQTWYCFGACNEGGDVISFLQKWENIDFLEALKILSKKAGVKLQSYTPSDSSKTKEKLYEINHLASEYYYYLLTKHKTGKRALEYLHSRGIKDRTVKTFKLGYAPKSWESTMKFLQNKGYKKQEMLNAGLLIKSDRGTYYDRFRGRVIFALFDPRGNIVGFSGRKLEEKDKEAKYINTPETPIYHKRETLYGFNITRDAIRKKDKAIVVEGEFDLLASFQIGVSNIVAIKGSALTQDQIMLLSRYTQNLLLALDSDIAGNEAAKKGIEIADSKGMSVQVVELLEDKDPADCIEKSPHLWKKSIKKAVPVFDFVINTAFKKYDKNDILGKKKIGDEVFPFLAKITNPIIRSHYVKILSLQLEVTEESVDLAISKVAKGKKQNVRSKIDKIKPTDRDRVLEEHLLSLILQGEDPKASLTKALKVLDIADFKNSAVAKIIDILDRFFKKRENLDVEKLNKAISEELSPTFDRCYMTDQSKILDNEKIYQKELEKVIFEVKKLSLRKRASEISTKIDKEEKEGRKKSINKLKKELNMVLNALGEIKRK